MRTRWLVVSLVVASLAPTARALDVANGKLTLSGFGEWGYGRTSNENAYSVGTEDGSYENAQFALQVTARPQDDVVVVGQLFVSREGEVSLDWAFGEWRVSDELRLRVGKVKNPFGLFMEVKDVGTVRPFFTLPQTVYGPTDFSAESYLGAGITGEWQGASGWGAAYDLYVGALEIPSFEPSLAIVNAASGVPPYYFSDYPEHEALATNVVGGRVGVLTPVEGLTLRVSGFVGQIEEAGEEKQDISCVGLSAEYAVDRFQLRGEWFRSSEGEESNEGGYAELAWNVMTRLQLAVRYEGSFQHLEADVPSQYREHREAAVGIGFWQSPNLVFKASYHRVHGNRFAVPAVSAPDGTVDDDTDLFVAGAQFSF